MLTAELVRVRRQKGELNIIDIDDKSRPRLLELAALLIGTVQSRIGATREELEAALSELEVSIKDQRVADALIKLLDDRCEFDSPVTAAPDQLRREVFLRAAEVRKALAEGEAFDRVAVLEEIAEKRQMDPLELEASLYADLRGSHVLKALPEISPEQLLEVYAQAQPQAVLLRAVRVAVTVQCSSPAAYRALFHKLKFLRLLYAIKPADKGSYRIEIDGPYSMFDAVTKYGLKLAMLLPVLEECDSWDLVADVRWGKERTPLVFRRKGGTARAGEVAAAPVADEVTQLIKGFKALPTLWKVQPSTALLALEGVGLCVPDLVFEHRATKEKIFLEVMGYWSRDAVWQRVDLVEKGLTERILFAVSERLRVSEQVLGDDAPAALYVYKGVMSPKVLAERLEALRLRPSPAGVTTPALGDAQAAPPSTKKRRASAKKSKDEAE